MTAAFSEVRGSTFSEGQGATFGVNDMGQRMSMEQKSFWFWLSWTLPDKTQAFRHTKRNHAISQDMVFAWIFVASSVMMEEPHHWENFILVELFHIILHQTLYLHFKHLWMTCDLAFAIPLGCTLDFSHWHRGCFFPMIQGCSISDSGIAVLLQRLLAHHDTTKVTSSGDGAERCCWHGW